MPHGPFLCAYFQTPINILSCCKGEAILILVVLQSYILIPEEMSNSTQVVGCSPG
jgi:hypothetical protein